ncbi:MAG: hypothetical protein L0227_00480, partial [Chloroflexi bacterium]|nr:hypothetical protein [Chloroflexota bacterium]
VMGLPDDVLTAMTAQRDEVARLLGENPELWTTGRPGSTLGHLSSQLRRALSGSPELEAMRAPRQRVVYAQQIDDLNSAYGSLRDPAYLRSAFDDPSGLPNLDQTTANALADPLLGPDPALAVARAGRQSRDDAAEYLVTRAAEVPLLGENYNNVAAELGRWASDLSDMQPSALKGALRADPAAAEAYSALLEALRAAGLTPPNPIRG